VLYFSRTERSALMAVVFLLQRYFRKGNDAKHPAFSKLKMAEQQTKSEQDRLPCFDPYV